MKIYCDTNINLDYLLERKNLSNKKISNPAYKIFLRTLECEFKIIISDHVLRELYANIEVEKAKILFSFLKIKIILVKTLNKDKIKASEYSNYNDALHAIIANRFNAQIMVTRNIKDFKEFSFIKSKLPEQI